MALSTLHSIVKRVLSPFVPALAVEKDNKAKSSLKTTFSTPEPLFLKPSVTSQILDSSRASQSVFPRMAWNSKIKVYLIARISPEAHPWNEEVVSSLKPPIEVFVPHQHNPWNISHEKIQYNVFETDRQAMIESDMALALPEFGADCSWEIGWYSGVKKPVVLFTEKSAYWLRHWMVKGSLPYIVTNSGDTFRAINNDAMFQHKQSLGLVQIFQIQQLDELNQIILQIHHAVPREAKD